LLRRCAFEALEPRRLLALTVTNVDGSGPASLRQVILDANGLAGSTQTIAFAIPSGPQTVDLLSPLPAAAFPLVLQLDAAQNVTSIRPLETAKTTMGTSPECRRPAAELLKSCQKRGIRNVTGLGILDCSIGPNLPAALK
jgi:hypothetical protein